MGAAIVVGAACWVLAVLWFVSNGAPSAAGEPFDIMVVEPAPTMPPLSDEVAPTVASGANSR